MGSGVGIGVGSAMTLIGVGVGEIVGVIMITSALSETVISSSILGICLTQLAHSNDIETTINNKYIYPF